MLNEIKFYLDMRAGKNINFREQYLIWPFLVGLIILIQEYILAYMYIEEQKVYNRVWKDIKV